MGEWKEGIERIYEFMKKPFIWALALVTLCAVFTLTAPKSRAADIQADGSKDLLELLKGAEDGATIPLSGSYHVTLSNDMPLRIDKAVTFEGGDITLWVGGIILDADVTFRNTTLSFDGFVRNAIMANGHTLTLENVTCAASGRPLNLFCGGLYDSQLGSTQCSAGTVVIRGRTSLEGSINTVTNEVGNIYAGNLCMGGMNENVSNVDGPPNTCLGDAEIIIEADSGSTLGKIYAGGAQQRIPAGAAHGKVILTNPQAYKVSGNVHVQLHAATVTYVNGLGAAETHVTYTDTRDNKYLMDGLGVYCVSGLTVESGYVSLKADSSFVEGASLAVDPGAKLGLEQMGNVAVGSFAGGGRLGLGEQQTLTVTGAVDGETKVQIGKILFVPKEDYPYIQAPSSSESSFTLIPPGSRPDLAFAESGGTWTVKSNRPSVDPVIVQSFCFTEKTVLIGQDAGTTYSADLALTVSYVDNNAVLQYLSFLPLEIHVNGVPAVFGEYEDEGAAFTHYVCETEYGDLSLELTSDADSEYLTVHPKAYTEGNYLASLPNGTYIIELTVPGEHTQSGSPLSDTVTLTVGESGSIPDTGIIGGISPGDVTSNTVRIYLAAPGGPVKAGTVMAAVYDGKGRLVSFGSVQIPEGGSNAVDVPVHLSDGKTVKAFLTNEQKPLCPSQSISI